MLGLDITESEEIEVYGGKWRIGAIPWGKLELLRLALSRAYEGVTAAGARLRDATDEAGKREAVHDWQAARVPYLEAAGEIVRYGVRATPSAALNAVPLGREQVAGVEVPVLSPSVVEVLKRVEQTGPDAPRLIDALAARVLEANELRPEDLLGFE